MILANGAGKTSCLTTCLDSFRMRFSDLQDLFRQMFIQISNNCPKQRHSRFAIVTSNPTAQVFRPAQPACPAVHHPRHGGNHQATKHAEPAPGVPKPHLLKIWRAEIVERSGGAGEILSADKSGIVAGCGQGALRILELQPESGRRMSAAEFLAGHALKAGQLLDG